MEDTNLQLASQSEKSPSPEATPLAEALGRVGDRWSFLVVDALLEGPRRFNDLQEAVPGIATNVLSQRVRNLEAQGVVLARPYSERPVRYSYELTAAGRELAGVLRLLARWGAERAGPGPHPTLRLAEHAACGSPLEARWYCPTCDRAIDDDEAQSLVFL
jgi:DNA-binding HxlR family transcriptional regulator